MSKTKKKKILNEEEYTKVCKFVDKYHGLAIDCELEMVNSVFPHIEKQTLQSILQTELSNRTRVSYWQYDAKAKIHLQYFEEQSATSESNTILLDKAICERMSPSLLCRNVLQEKYKFQHKSQLTRVIISPNLIEDSKLAANVAQCIFSDNQDGPLMDMRRRVLGEEYEFKLKQMAQSANMTYYDENDLRRMGFDKTPDLKIILPFLYKGNVVNWIESKASFGDVRTHKRNMQMQLTSYSNRFGPGIVIYWFGYHEDTPKLSENSVGVIVLDDFPTFDCLEFLNIGLNAVETTKTLPLETKSENSTTESATDDGASATMGIKSLSIKST